MASSSSASSSSLSPELQSSISLLDSVYGPVDSPSFPLPMPENEAGLCADGYQRRYLWTDAFGVLAYVSLANKLEQQQQQGDSSQQMTEQAQRYRSAAQKLIQVVHDCLGKPRSSKPMDAMQVDSSSPTGYVGLRIGKVDGRRVTDHGMRYDGQYWHYLDKWLLALSRAGRNQDAIQIAKSLFPHFFDAGPNGDGHNGGIRWKLSADATPPPPLQRAQASDDSLVALIVFSILQQQQQQQQQASSNLDGNNNNNNNDNNRENHLTLTKEINLLQTCLKSYRPRVTDDPLGWGLKAIFDQFIEGHPRKNALESLASRALDAESHFLSLPFRWYGAMIGARTTGIIGLQQQQQSDNHHHHNQTTAEQWIQRALQYETTLRAPEEEQEEHSSINRVMLAMYFLCPQSALDRQPQDPLIRLE